MQQKSSQSLDTCAGYKQQDAHEFYLSLLSGLGGAIIRPTDTQLDPSSTQSATQSLSGIAPTTATALTAPTSNAPVPSLSRLGGHNGHTNTANKDGTKAVTSHELELSSAEQVGNSEPGCGVREFGHGGRMSLTPEPEWHGKGENGLSFSGQDGSSSGDVSEAQAVSAGQAGFASGSRMPEKPAQSVKLQAAARQLQVQSQLQRCVRLV